MIKDLEKVGDKIKYILERFPECRDDDKMLWLGYNVVFNGLKQFFGTEIEYQRFKKFLLAPNTPMFESLSRARRKIQEELPHLAGKKEQRLEEATAVKDWSRGSYVNN